MHHIRYVLWNSNSVSLRGRTDWSVVEWLRNPQKHQGDLTSLLSNTRNHCSFGSDFNKSEIYRQNFIKIPVIKFHGNPSREGGGCGDKYTRSDVRLSTSKVILTSLTDSQHNQHDKYQLLYIQCWDSWRWTVNLSETCRVLYHDKVEKQCTFLGFIISIRTRIFDTSQNVSVLPEDDPLRAETCRRVIVGLKWF